MLKSQNTKSPAKTETSRILPFGSGVSDASSNEMRLFYPMVHTRLQSMNTRLKSFLSLQNNSTIRKDQIIALVGLIIHAIAAATSGLLRRLHRFELKMADTTLFTD